MIFANYIGVSAGGLIAIPNGQQGVCIDRGTSLIVIGSDTAGERNVIADNGASVMTGGTFELGASPLTRPGCASAPKAHPGVVG